MPKNDAAATAKRILARSAADKGLAAVQSIAWMLERDAQGLPGAGSIFQADAVRFAREAWHLALQRVALDPDPDGLRPGSRRMLDTLRSLSDRERRKHGNQGWVELWHVFDEWGWRMSVHLVPLAAKRTWEVLEDHGLVEHHPEHDDLVRPKR